MKQALSMLVAAALAVALPAAVSAAPTTAETLGRMNEVLAAPSASDFVERFTTLSTSQQRRFVRYLRLDPRIAGGAPVTIEEYPWQVALIRGYALEPMRSQFCGGTLVTPTRVVTAAHCLDNAIVRNEPTRVDIVAGTAFYGSGGERITVSSLFIHPQWDAEHFDYDIAVLELSTPVQRGRPINALLEEVVPGEVARVSGWGARFEGGPGSPDLLAARVPIVAPQDCTKEESYGADLTERMICAGFRDGGIDACQGDSGGPLVVERDGAVWLAGVVSWGEGCARRLKYGVYTRLSAVTQWLEPLVGQSTAQASREAGSLAISPESMP